MGGIRVLLAEDDPNVRSALAAIIRSEPALELADAVSDALEAIAAAEREQPDVALIDVRMPGGGGPVAVRGIKRCAPGTKILALSAHDDRSTVMEMLEAGVVGYLVKGSSLETILVSIERAAAGLGSLSVEVTGDVIDELAEQLGVQRRADERQRRRETRIRRVLEDEGALEMVFQPICTIDGERVGAEALARFRGPPKRGPARWFAEAGDVGLRRELEIAAVRAALSELADWPDGLYLSVNVSPATVTAAAFRKVFRDVDATRVVVEITEHAPIDDYERLADALGGLRSAGVRLAIDDAGAGFASLRHILRLDPDFIKLDRTLIQGIQADRSRQALAAGLISFAEKIGATIVAEGIERLGELRALRALGVGYGQGFYLARPGTVAELLPSAARRVRRAG